MSFGSSPSPPPMMVPPSPQPATQLTPTGGKPQRKPMQPTFIGQALTPTPATLGGGGPKLLGT